MQGINTIKFVQKFMSDAAFRRCEEASAERRVCLMHTEDLQELASIRAQMLVTSR
jgi:hypothetical protein